MRTVHTPAARSTDASSSHEAADEMTRSGKRAFQQSVVAQAVARHPGCTSMELSHRAKLERYMVARRLSECEEAQEVRRGPMKLCPVSKRQALTWWPAGTPIQLELVR
jgi:hypothetical protein